MSILLASGRAIFKTSEKMNKKYVKHGIASVSTKSQKIKVNVLLAFGRVIFRIILETLEKMNKKYVKHGIASVSTKSQKTKVNVLLTFKNQFTEIFLKKWEKITLSMV